MKSAPDIFYVYVLFDHCGIPRYVGKGKGRRWDYHGTVWDTCNKRKTAFIRETISALGELPRVKIRQGLCEPAAFDLEAMLIRAIGRYPNGPLMNATEKRHGPTSERMRQWWATQTPEQRSARIRKARATDLLKNGAEAVKLRMSRNALAAGRDELSQRMAKQRATQTSEQRRAIARKAGLASASKVSIEVKREQARKGRETYMATTTKAQRSEAAKRTLGLFTKEQLSAFGKKGVAVANANRTPAQRIALAKKARASHRLKIAASKHDKDRSSALSATIAPSTLP